MEPPIAASKSPLTFLLAGLSISSSLGRVHYTPPYTANHRIRIFFRELANDAEFREDLENCEIGTELPWVRLVNGRDIGLVIRKRAGSGQVPLEYCAPEKYEELFEDNVKIA